MRARVVTLSAAVGVTAALVLGSLPAEARPSVADPAPDPLPALGAYPGTALLGLCGAEVCVANPGEPPRRLTFDGAARPKIGVSASRDGAKVAYVAAGAAYYGDPVKGSFDRLSSAPGTGPVRLSASGVDFVLTYTTANGPELRAGGKSGPRNYFYPDASYSSALNSRRDFVVASTSTVCVVREVNSFVLPACSSGAGANPDPDTAFGVPAVSPDDALIAVAARGLAGSSLLLYDAASGTLLRRLTVGPDDADPSFSPDGSQIAFSRSGSTWVVPVVGGAPTLVAAGLVSPTWIVRGGAAAPADPVLRGSHKLGVRGRNLRLRFSCVTKACAETTWELRHRRSGRLFTTIDLPRIPRSDRVRPVRLSRAEARRVHRSERGLKLRLVIPGSRDLNVRLVSK